MPGREPRGQHSSVLPALCAHTTPGGPLHGGLAGGVSRLASESVPPGTLSLSLSFLIYKGGPRTYGSQYKVSGTQKPPSRGELPPLLPQGRSTPRSAEDRDCRSPVRGDSGPWGTGRGGGPGYKSSDAHRMWARRLSE